MLGSNVSALENTVFPNWQCWYWRDRAYELWLMPVPEAKSAPQTGEFFIYSCGHSMAGAGSRILSSKVAVTSVGSFVPKNGRKCVATRCSTSYVVYRSLNR